MTQSNIHVKAALDNGNLLLAYDLALSAIESGNETTEIKHLMVLALARMGDADRAMELYNQYGLGASSDPHHRAISARILKDTALATTSDTERRAALLLAFAAYEELYQESGDAYPGINAATLALLAGETERARNLAVAISQLPEIINFTNYYDAATRAEALLILGQVENVSAILSEARKLPDANSGAKSSSSRQLALVAQEIGLDIEQKNTLLAPILPPSVIHFCGHIFLEEEKVEAELRKSIDEFLEQYDVGYAYGALAAGSDILIAEAVLARGGELHITLPFNKEDFIEHSVAPAGDGWLERYYKCIAAATRVNLATEMNYVGDPEQFSYSSKVAMGMATLRAEFLSRPARQLAIWDGIGSEGKAGTGADVATWRNCGGLSTVLESPGINRSFNRPPAPGGDEHKRRVAALLFTDFPGFSKLPESSLPAFWGGVMGTMGDVLQEYEGKILAQNTWGDAVHAVAEDATSAAEIALKLQGALMDFDYALLGLSESSGMRIGVHHGPVYEIEDRITKRASFYGTEVSRAARIEPVTPPGAVFVTEPFAAILALESPHRFKCQYVGNVEFAKGYGNYPIYALTGNSVLASTVMLN